MMGLGLVMSRRGVERWVGVAALGLTVSVTAFSLPAYADTLLGALTQAYGSNPSLNSQRAAVRATDENVSQALAGYRPKISATATGGEPQPAAKRDDSGRWTETRHEGFLLVLFAKNGADGTGPSEDRAAQRHAV